ncbi:MAG: hypothetical protein FD147_2239 [Chloroflexi bacterium]|nr:MAG: hypothetical protein FD147_2239 [Chloroflexota bacterium]
MANVVYGVASWFNILCRIWGTIAVQGKTVKSYLLEEIPESVNVFPSAISFLESVDANYSLGGPSTGVYQGKTEFHLTGSLVRSQMGFVMQFPDKVIAAAATKLTLDGKVVNFRIVNPGSIKPVQLTWGNEQEHFGLIVPWIVQENQSGKYTVSA